MRLKNKKTGEIVTPEAFRFCLLKGDKNRGIGINGHWYNSLAGFAKDWEDYEEPKDYYHITSDGNNYICEDTNDDFDKGCKAIGNYFETKEEAEQAVEKLKAWKRLRDKGFRFYRKWNSKEPEGAFYYVEIHAKIDPVPSDIGFMKDLDLLFGGEQPVNRDSDGIRYTGKEKE